MGQIRLETDWDDRAVRQLLTSAFGSRAEAELVERLRATGDAVPQLCLVADQQSVVVGHIFYSRAHLGTPAGTPVLALAPMAVTPAFQRRGIGTALVEESLARAEARDEALIVVVGHPDYYPRFGFRPAAELGLESPWPDIPDEAFMARTLPAYRPDMKGLVCYAEPFYDSEP